MLIKLLISAAVGLASFASAKDPSADVSQTSDISSQSLKTLKQSCATTSQLRSLAVSEKWALTYLALANIAYANGTKAEIQYSTTSIPRIVKALPDPNCGTGEKVDRASFSVPYGPVYTDNNSNLMYIAEYKNDAGETIFYAVSIRGTQSGTGTVSLYSQVFQDLDATHRVDWSKIEGKADLSKVECTTGADSTRAAIAKGTCNGMGKLMSLKFMGEGATVPETPMQFLTRQLKKQPSAPVIVTGHSLGGTQTEAISLWLKSVLPEGTTVSAVPFAPASAGNVPFATKWNEQIGAVSWLWANKYDIVPWAFEDVKRVKEMYQMYGGPRFPYDLLIFINGFIDTLAAQKNPYMQPGRNKFWLDSALVVRADTKDNWSNQVGVQHFPPQYYKLMCQQYVNGAKRIFDYKFQGLGTNAGWKNCADAGVLPPAPELTYGAYAPDCHTKAGKTAKCCCAPQATKTVTVRRAKTTVTKKAKATRGSVQERQVRGQHLCPSCSSLKPQDFGKKCCGPKQTVTVYKTIS